MRSGRNTVVGVTNIDNSKTAPIHYRRENQILTSRGARPNPNPVQTSAEDEYYSSEYYTSEEEERPRQRQPQPQKQPQQPQQRPPTKPVQTTSSAAPSAAKPQKIISVDSRGNVMVSTKPAPSTTRVSAPKMVGARSVSQAQRAATIGLQPQPRVSMNDLAETLSKIPRGKLTVNPDHLNDISYEEAMPSGVIMRDHFNGDIGCFLPSSEQEEFYHKSVYDDVQPGETGNFVKSEYTRNNIGLSDVADELKFGDDAFLTRNPTQRVPVDIFTNEDTGEQFLIYEDEMPTPNGNWSLSKEDLAETNDHLLRLMGSLSADPEHELKHKPDARENPFPTYDEGRALNGIELPQDDDGEDARENMEKRVARELFNNKQGIYDQMPAPESAALQGKFGFVGYQNMLRINPHVSTRRDVYTGDYFANADNIPNPRPGDFEATLPAVPFYGIGEKTNVRGGEHAYAGDMFHAASHNLPVCTTKFRDHMADMSNDVFGTIDAPDFGKMTLAELNEAIKIGEKALLRVGNADAGTDLGGLTQAQIRQVLKTGEFSQSRISNANLLEGMGGMTKAQINEALKRGEFAQTRSANVDTLGDAGGMTYAERIEQLQREILRMSRPGNVDVLEGTFTGRTPVDLKPQLSREVLHNTRVANVDTLTTIAQSAATLADIAESLKTKSRSNTRVANADTLSTIGQSAATMVSLMEGLKTKSRSVSRVSNPEVEVASASALRLASIADQLSRENLANTRIGNADLLTEMASTAAQLAHISESLKTKHIAMLRSSNPDALGETGRRTTAQQNGFQGVGEYAVSRSANVDILGETGRATRSQLNPHLKMGGERAGRGGYSGEHLATQGNNTHTTRENNRLGVKRGTHEDNIAGAVDASHVRTDHTGVAASGFVERGKTNLKQIETMTRTPNPHVELGTVMKRINKIDPHRQDAQTNQNNGAFADIGRGTDRAAMRTPISSLRNTQSEPDRFLGISKVKTDVGGVYQDTNFNTELSNTSRGVGKEYDYLNDRISATSDIRPRTDNMYAALTHDNLNGAGCTSTRRDQDQIDEINDRMSQISGASFRNGF